MCFLVLNEQRILGCSSNLYLARAINRIRYYDLGASFRLEPQLKLFTVKTLSEKEGPELWMMSVLFVSSYKTG